MAILQPAAFKGYRDFTKKMISRARFRINSEWFETELIDVKTMDPGKVEISFMISIRNGFGTVSLVELYDKNGELWLSKTESINLSNVSEGYLYVVSIEIKEVS